MHDCVKTRELLVDLVFDELGPEARRRALLEIEGCPDCLAQYRSMTEALRVFDQATEAAMPEESYWPGYETRLRERLRLTRPSWTRRLADWIGGFGPLTVGPLPVAAGLALVLLAIGWWTWQRRQTLGPSPITPEVARETPTPRLTVVSHDEVIANTPKPGEIPKRPTSVRPTTHVAAAKSNGKAPSVRREERREEIFENIVVSRGSDQPFVAASLFTPETIRHFEKAQLMLRSFRNASAAKSLAATDLAYERQLSRRLLYQNILLRRDAEMKGNLPAEEALGSLEPFLLDIANLPDKPSSGELGAIRERMQRKELIASLQISSAQPSAPAYKIP
ncbi:MAG TPA: hypothetical protein VG324_08120 [Blastocatellia bacterium]|nr:hypothetical protein [Blastocatellia bacterium]